jgi:hypothetical protein
MLIHNKKRRTYEELFITFSILFVKPELLREHSPKKAK